MGRANSSSCRRAVFWLLLLLFLFWRVKDGILGVSGSGDKYKAESENLYVLTDKNFDDFIKETRICLVLFYASWCHWSIAMMDSFKSAASMMAHNVPGVTFAKLDATVNPAVRDSQHISGFPTLKLFVVGAETPYTGGRHQTQIVKFLSEFFDSEVTLTSPQHLHATLEGHIDEVVVIGGFSINASHSANSQGLVVLESEFGNGTTGHTQKDVAAINFVKLSREFKHMFFADISDSATTDALIGKFSNLPSTLASPFLVVVNPYNHKSEVQESQKIFASVVKGEPPTFMYPGSFDDFSAMKAFLQQFRLPSVIPFTHTTLVNVFSDGRPLFVMFVDPNAVDAASHVEALLPTALQLRPKLLFLVSFDTSAMDSRLSHILDASDLAKPVYRICTVSASWGCEYKYFPPEESPSVFSSKDVRHFADQYLSQKLSPHLQSEPLPEANDGPVRILVGTTFEDEVRKSPNEVFVVLFAPWCGHCRKLEPTLVEVGKLLQPHSHILVAKIDATRNEIPGVQIAGYPTLLFYPAGKKSSPLFYRGERKASSIVEWIAANAGRKFDPRGVLNGDALYNRYGDGYGYGDGGGVNQQVVEEL